MFSVIIPTMWKCDRLHITLLELNSNPLVGEILLFDNTDNTKPIEGLSKLVHILEGKNTYVTAPWNKGVRMAKYDKLLVLNDDTWFDWCVIGSIEPFVTDKIGGIGMWEQNFEIKTKNTDLDLAIIEFRPPGWGVAIFIHRGSWIPIPEEMMIWGQDDWLFAKNRELGKPNIMISGLKLEGSVSLTINSLKNNSEIDTIKQNDLRLKKLYNLF